MAESLISANSSAGGSGSVTINVQAQGNFNSSFNVAVSDPIIGFLFAKSGINDGLTGPLPTTWFVVVGSTLTELPIGMHVTNGGDISSSTVSAGSLSLTSTTFTYTAGNYYCYAGTYLVLG